MAYINVVLEKVFPYEGIPEIILDFVELKQKYRQSSPEFRKILEKKHYRKSSKLRYIRTYLGKYLHSFDDKPASNTVKNQKWFFLGRLHREGDKPAIVHFRDGVPTGEEEWWIEGDKHRDDDKPAIIYPGGSAEWFVKGKKHREGGQPSLISSTSYKEWWVNNKLVKREGWSSDD